LASFGKGDPSKGEKVRTGELERGMFYDFAQYRRQHNQNVQDVTIRNEETTFNALFKWAERNGLTHFDRVDFEEIKIRNVGRRDAFTIEDYEKLYSAIRWKDWLNRARSEKEREQKRFIRGGPGCLNRICASISGASAGVRLPSGGAAA
jgi:hypothetical protein